MKKDYQIRDKFFYAVPSLYPLWPYKSRLAIGVKLDDAEYRNSSIFRFKIKGTTYAISREKAIDLGNRYKMVGGALPNLLPKEEFTVVSVEPYIKPIKPTYIFDEETNTVRIIIPKQEKKLAVQLTIL